MKIGSQADLVSSLKEAFANITVFTNSFSGIRLRNYQRDVAEAIVSSVLHQEGGSFVVMFPRQSGKNELQAQIETYLLMLFSQSGGEIVKISPTWKPQSLNAMRRLESTLRRNIITKDLWQKESGYIYRIGEARILFLSGAPESNIVGATASLLLEVDEAQDVLAAKYEREIAPMASSRNSTRVFWGTAWTAETLLARELAAARKFEQESCQSGNLLARRAFCINAEIVAAEVPAYGRFVQEQVRKLGRQHPMIRTQYFCEEFGGENQLFHEDRIKSMQSDHPPRTAPQASDWIVILADVAGADETSGKTFGETEAVDRRDATAITICSIAYPDAKSEFARSDSVQPVWSVLQRVLWTNLPLSEQYVRLTEMIRIWDPKRIIIDATGIGAGLSSFLIRTVGASRVIPFTFSASSKSKLGWDFLALIDSGRWHEYLTALDDFDKEQSALQTLFFQQLRSCRSEIHPGPARILRWGVPEGVRDPVNGDIVHDDLVFSAALAACLDHDLTSDAFETLIISGSDPLEEMDKGF